VVSIFLMYINHIWHLMATVLSDSLYLDGPFNTFSWL